MSLKKIVSMFLSAAVLCGSLPALFLPASAAETEKSYAIWDANPENLPEGSTGLAEHGGTWFEKFTGYVALSSDGDGFIVTLNATGENGMAPMLSGLKPNDGRISGWQSDKVFIKALMQYAEMSFEARRTDQGAAAEFEIGMASPWGKYNDARFGTIAADDPLNTERNEWHSYTLNTISESAGDHWGDGAFRFGAISGEISEESPAVIELRRVRLTLDESDRLAFNQYLADINYECNGGWDWNHFTPAKDSNGNDDYFAQLIKYDNLSEYSPNIFDITDATSDANGSIDISADSAREGEIITVTASPAEGYRVNLIAVSDAGGKALLLDRTETNVYRFTMPQSAVTVKAEFSAVSAEDEARYVIWAADPKKVSEEDGTSAKPAWASTVDGWQFANNTTGTGAVRYNEEIPYYEVKLTGAGDRNGAVIEAGFVEFGHNNGEGFLGWVAHRRVLEAIDDYISISYDICVEDLSGREITLKMGPQPQYTNKSAYEAYGTFDTYENVSVEGWVTRSVPIGEILHTDDGNPHWSCADLLISLADTVEGVSSESPLTIKIRNIRLSLSESDRAAINSQLSAVDGIDALRFFTADWDGKTPFSDFPKTEDGKNDYFEGLVFYDGVSSYSETFAAGDLNQDKAVDIRDLVRFKKYAADYKEKVNYSSADCDGNGSIEMSVDMAALRKLLMSR